MINQENLNKIYNAVISDKTLTTKELTSYGFTSTDLRKLKEQGIIENIKRGEYQLASLNHLYNHGVNELSLGNPHSAMLYFNKCIDLDPNHLPSYLQMILFHIKNSSYQKVYKILDKLSEVPSCKPEIRNLYLYLLSFITELPAKYQEEVLSLTEVAYLTNREFETEEDKIIRKIYEGKFLPAMHNLKISLEENPDKIELVITKMLLSQAINTEKKLSKELLELAKKERYNDIQIILENKTKISKNKLSDQYALLLSKMIQQILRTGEIPEVLLIKLIYARDYYLEGEFELGDKLLHEVEKSFHLTNKVSKLLNEIRTNKDQSQIKIHSKKKELKK